MPLHRLRAPFALAVALAMAAPAHAETTSDAPCDTEAGLHAIDPADAPPECPPLEEPAPGDPVDEQLDDLLDVAPPPEFLPGFLKHRWQFAGVGGGYEDGVLAMTVTRVLKLPARWRDQDDALLDKSSAILIERRTKVLGRSCRRRLPRRALSTAKSVRVDGKVLSPADWEETEEGELRPTIRAKRICVQRTSS